MKMRMSLLTLAAMIAVVLAGCGGYGFDAEALATFEGRWLCDVQKSTYADLSEIEAALEERLATAAISDEEYKEFKDSIGNDENLREMVSVEYDRFCPEE